MTVFSLIVISLSCTIFVILYAIIETNFIRNAQRTALWLFYYFTKIRRFIMFSLMKFPGIRKKIIENKIKNLPPLEKEYIRRIELQ